MTHLYPHEPLLPALLDEGPPLDRDDWSLDDDGLEVVLAAIAGGRRRVIECGSGASTILIARLMRRLEAGCVHAIEHDADTAREIADGLAAEGLGRFGAVHHAPLVEDPASQPGCRWYDRQALTALPREADLLLVDGPPASPGSGAERSRYPALPVLKARLAPNCLVMLDDIGREGERWVAERWRVAFGVELEQVAARFAAGEFRSTDR